MAALRKIVDENSKDEANKDMVIAEHPDVSKLEEKARSSWCCGCLNCLIRQHICYNQKIKRQYLGKCTGQKATFSNNLSYAHVGKPKPKSKYAKKQKPDTNGSITNITASPGSTPTPTMKYTQREVLELKNRNISKE